MAENPLVRIMNPGSVAFAGASNNPMKMGTVQLANLLHGGFEGRVYPLHPSEKTVLGLRAYQEPSDLPEPVDLAILVLPTRIVPEYLKKLGRRGVKYAVIISGGFKEVGGEGEGLQEKMVQVAKEYGIRFVGPNCIGVINTRHCFNTTFFPYTRTPGNIGIVSQSGTYVTQIILHLNRMGIGYSQAISVGNEANIDIVEGMEYLASDPDTRAIGLYIEGIRRGSQFIRTAKKIVPHKPIVALYVGGSEAGARSSMSHTAALSGTDEVYDGLFAQCGVIRATSVEELFEWSWSLATQPLPRGKNMVILTNSGGPGASMADSLCRLGLVVPVLPPETQERIKSLLPHTATFINPIDITFHMDFSVFAEELPRIVLSSPHVDGLLIHGIMGSSFLIPLQKISPNLKNMTLDQLGEMTKGQFSPLVQYPREFDKPILCSSFAGREDLAVAFLHDNDIPCLPAPERAARAMYALYQYARIKKKFQGNI